MIEIGRDMPRCLLWIAAVSVKKFGDDEFRRLIILGFLKWIRLLCD
jgi:hypothetical protein